MNLKNNIFLALLPLDTKERFYVRESSNPEEVGKHYDIVKDYEAFLINNTSENLENVNILSGAFDGSGEELIQTSPITLKFPRIEAKSKILLDKLDYGMLDFVIWYKVTFNIKEVSREINLSILKAYALKDENFIKTPILDKKSYIFLPE